MTTISGLRVHRPESLSEASSLFRRYGDDAAFVAGGTELLLLLRLGLTHFDHLISLRRIPGMSDLTVSPEGDLVMGGGVTHLHVADSPIVRQRNRAFADAEGALANLRVRASGTLAGNLAFADPHSDTLTLLMALDARVRCEGPSGVRQVSADAMMVGPFTTVLEPGEVISALVVPARSLASPLAHQRFESARQRPMVTVSCSGQLDEDGRFGDVRLVVGSVCAKPVLLPVVERLLGSRPDELGPEAIAATGVAAAAEVPLRGDEDGAADYKSALVSALVGRAVRSLVDSATSRKDSRMP